MLSSVDHRHGLCRAITSGLRSLEKLHQNLPLTSRDGVALRDLLLGLDSVHDEQAELRRSIATTSLASGGSARLRVADQVVNARPDALQRAMADLQPIALTSEAATPEAIRSIQKTCLEVLKLLEGEVATIDDDAELAH